RAAYHDPYLLHRLDVAWFGGELRPRAELLRALRPWVERWLGQGIPLKRTTRHLLGLFNGERGGRAFRQVLSEGAHKPGADWSLSSTRSPPPKPSRPRPRTRPVLTRDPDAFLEFARGVAPDFGPATAKGVFLVAPDGFALATESASDNRYMAGAGAFDASRALAEHRALQAALSRVLPTVCFAGDPETPDAV